MKYKFFVLIMAVISTINAQDVNIITEYNSPPPGVILESDKAKNNLADIDIETTPIILEKAAPGIAQTQNKHKDHKDYLLNSFYGHVGLFGKTNMLGKNNDSYGVFSASMGLTYDIQDTLYFGIGIYGMIPFMGYPNNNSRDYVISKFSTNNAYIKYIAEDFFTVSVGRYHENRDWLKHYIQGIGIDIDYRWVKVWGNWVDEQAHANREHLTDFNIFKTTYNRQWLGAAGINIRLFDLDIEPYYYFMNNHFWSVGGKLNLDIDINDKWNTTTVIHYTYLDTKINGLNNENGHSASADNTALRDNSSIFWFEEAIKYSENNNSVLFGLGFAKVWKSYFELANIGNMSRFETHSHSDYDVIEPGGVDNGTNTSNMFNANTRSIYGFIGFKVNNFSAMFLGRNSASREIKQDSYSLGAKWKIIEGLSIGGVGAYMVENKRNMSFAKGYIEFEI